MCYLWQNDYQFQNEISCQKESEWFQSLNLTHVQENSHQIYELDELTLIDFRKIEKD